jgi:diphthamide biosynthesis methyltransferase
MAAIYRGDRRAMSYGSHRIVTTAHDDVINVLRRGTPMVNGVHAGDGRSATSPVRTDE